MNITEFLLARIAEDEAVAQAASSGRWRPNVWGGVFNGDIDVTERGGADLDMSGEESPHYPQSSRDSVHIARHNPARVLAKCAAERRIVRLTTGDAYGWEDVQCALAAVYADHKDFQEEWRP